MSEPNQSSKVVYRKASAARGRRQLVVFLALFCLGIGAMGLAATSSEKTFHIIENDLENHLASATTTSPTGVVNEPVGTTSPGVAKSPDESPKGSNSGSGTTDNPTQSTPSSSPVTKPPITTPPISNPIPNPTPVPIPTPAPTPIPIDPIPMPNIPSVGSKFGLSLAGTLLGLSDSQVGARLDEVAVTGVEWIRIDVGWNDIERRDFEHTDWSGIDRIVNAANERGIHVLGILSYTPKWARDDGCPEINCPPADQDQFAEFSAAAVRRYAPKGVHAWEIWNEPNLNLNYWGGNATRYSNLLKVTYQAIHEVDPNATVISGGLSPAATRDGSMSPVDFLTALYSSGAGHSFDAVGMHPYSFPATPNYTQKWNAWSQMNDTGLTLRNVMTSNGDSSKKIWMTEFGAPTGGPENLATMSNYRSITNSDHVTEELQAEMLRQAFSLAQTYLWAGPLFWYSYKDLGEDEGDNENFFGIIRYDGSHKPAYDALRSMLGTN